MVLPKQAIALQGHCCHIILPGMTSSFLRRSFSACKGFHNASWYFWAKYQTCVFQFYLLAHIFCGALPKDPSALYGQPCYATSTLVSRPTTGCPKKSFMIEFLRFKNPGHSSAIFGTFGCSGHFLTFLGTLGTFEHFLAI